MRTIAECIYMLFSKDEPIVFIEWGNGTMTSGHATCPNHTCIVTCGWVGVR